MSSNQTLGMRKQFDRDGFVVIKHAVDRFLLDRIDDETDKWVNESRSHHQNYGETLDGKARFDLQPGHRADRPLLRRVSNPVDVSETFRKVLFEGPIVELVTGLIGPDVKFHHCKLNNKPPQSGVEVNYHQDHPFDPHTNDDIVVALLMLDDMTEDNGCLRVVPGSHKKRYSHYENDEFIGRIPSTDYERACEDAVSITGKRGDLVLQHTWLVHGGDANRTERTRRMLICDYAAADAIALTPVQMPSPYTGTIVAGVTSRQARTTQQYLELPPKYEDDSFFGVQQKLGTKNTANNR